jgi:hypothetical protein
VLRPVLFAAFGLASGGCVGGWWPSDGSDEPALGACLSTRRAPQIPGSADPNERLVVDATDTEASVVDVEIDAHGEDFVGAVRISHGVGTLELGCETVPIAVYQTFTSAGARVFRSLAVKTDRFYSVDVDCQDEQVTVVGYGATDGTDFTSESATGTCREVSAQTSARVTFPALDLSIPPLAQGYTIDGPEIVLASDGRGTVMLGARQHAIFAFNDFTCGRNCTAADNWRGLSAAIWDEPGQRLTYAFLFLYLPDGPVGLRSPISLPGFSDEVVVRDFDATFTLP